MPLQPRSQFSPRPHPRLGRLPFRHHSRFRLNSRCRPHRRFRPNSRCIPHRRFGRRRSGQCRATARAVVRPPPSPPPPPPSLPFPPSPAPSPPGHTPLLRPSPLQRPSPAPPAPDPTPPDPTSPEPLSPAPSPPAPTHPAPPTPAPTPPAPPPPDPTPPAPQPLAHTPQVRPPAHRPRPGSGPLRYLAPPWSPAPPRYPRHRAKTSRCSSPPPTPRCCSRGRAAPCGRVAPKPAALRLGLATRRGWSPSRN